MRRLSILLFLSLIFGVLPLWSQGTSDFAERFMEMNQDAESQLHCITVSPNMMEKIMKLPDDQNETSDKRIRKILSKCKSIRIIKTQAQPAQYREKAIGLLEKHKDRYAMYKEGNLKEENEDCLWVRKRGKNIVEVVVLSLQGSPQFSILDITGNLTTAFIGGLLGN